MIWSIVIYTCISLFMDLLHVGWFAFFQRLFTLPRMDHLVLTWTWVLVLFFSLSYLNLSLCFVFQFGFLYSLESIVWNRIIGCHCWFGLFRRLSRKCLEEFVLLHSSILYRCCDQIVSRSRTLHWCILRCVDEVCLLALQVLLLILLRPIHRYHILTWWRWICFSMEMLNFCDVGFSFGMLLRDCASPTPIHLLIWFV